MASACVLSHPTTYKMDNIHSHIFLQKTVFPTSRFLPAVSFFEKRTPKNYVIESLCCSCIIYFYFCCYLSRFIPVFFSSLTLLSSPSTPLIFWTYHLPFLPPFLPSLLLFLLHLREYQHQHQIFSRYEGHTHPPIEQHSTKLYDNFVLQRKKKKKWEIKKKEQMILEINRNKYELRVRNASSHRIFSFLLH